ncbi:MAG: hypothetical protein LBE03_02005 [Candidatus Nomurabacteria bacterium]|jgi:hypothetical protein|nr:hypothetical protein [Candidatus Nomurabacteria bacterium]
MKLRLNQRTNTILAIVILVFVIGIIAYNYIYNSIYSVVLTIQVAPNNATLTLNNEPITAGKHRLKPNDYILSASHDGFITQEKTISTASGDTPTVTIALIPNDGNYQWYADHPEDGIILDTTVSEQFDEALQKATEKYPILNYIPYTNESGGLKYTITPEYDESLKIFIKLNTCSTYSSEIYKAEALGWIKSKGFNPDDFDIEYSLLCN